MKSCHWLHFCFFPSKPSPNQKPSLLAVDSCHLSQEWLCLLSLLLAKVSFQFGRWGRVTIIYRVAAAQLLRCADIWVFADIISRSLQDLFFFNPHGHWCKVLSYWGFSIIFLEREWIFLSEQQVYNPSSFTHPLPLTALPEQWSSCNTIILTLLFSFITAPGWLTLHQSLCWHLWLQKIRSYHGSFWFFIP